MSIEAMSWALKQPVERSSAKFVLVALANYANAEGEAWPCVKSLSEDTSQDRKTVLENLKRLRVDGFIEATGVQKGVTGGVPVYRLSLLGNSPKNGTPEQYRKRNSTENGTVPKTDGSSPVFPAKQSRFSREAVPKTGHGTVIEPSIEPLRNQEEARERATTPPKPEGVSDGVWRDWLALRKSKRAAVTETVVDGARAEASKAGMVLDDFLREWCVRGSQGLKAEWLKPNGNAKSFGELETERKRARIREMTGGLMGGEPMNFVEVANAAKRLG